MSEPVWLTLRWTKTFHDELILAHGGESGILNEGRVQAALDRPRNLWAYTEADIVRLAATYGHGLALNHGFIDGNKRIAFMAMYVFLYRNGLKLYADEDEAYAAICDLVTSKLTEEALTDWLSRRVKPLD